MLAICREKVAPLKNSMAVSKSTIRQTQEKLSLAAIMSMDKKFMTRQHKLMKQSQDKSLKTIFELSKVVRIFHRENPLQPTPIAEIEQVTTMLKAEKKGMLAV